jgi:hypothetical protein
LKLSGMSFKHEFRCWQSRSDRSKLNETSVAIKDSVDLQIENDITLGEICNTFGWYGVTQSVLQRGFR